ncbi:MAG: TM0106 family RecB-like putative nuclease, partial [Actinomycetales bacterium]
MQTIDGEMVVSATDLVGFLHCEHLGWLERMAARGEVERPATDHPMLELLREQGNQHERAYLNRLHLEGADVVDVTQPKPAPPSDSATPPPRRLPTAAAAATRAAMEGGAGVIYQAALVDDSSSPTVIGFADFLRRVDAPSDLGDWSYEPEDTKLSSHVSAWAVLQLCSYSEQIARLQGVEPEFIHVVLGSGEKVSIRLAEISAYFRAATTRFDRFLAADTQEIPYPLPVSHCARCSWSPRCSQRWRSDDHLSQVAFMRMDQVRKMEKSGITTMAALA